MNQQPPPATPLPTGIQLVAPGGLPRPVDKYDAPSLVGNRGRFHVMAKPGSSTCNLDCQYCFYLGKAKLPGGPGTGRMSEETLERFIRQYIEGCTGPEVVFSWQGGEPTLMGLDFFRKVVAFQKQYARPGLKVQNDLQTNGTLINQGWCRFLKEHNFLVGLSIDGPKKIHDRYRVTKGREPTFDQVLNAARLLRKFQVPYNTLTCVHRLNARQPLDVYRFLRRELDSTYIQFIPIVEPTDFERAAPTPWASGAAALPGEGDPRSRPGHPESIVTDWSVDPDDWGYFLCKTFDEWRKRDVGKVYVSQFESLVAQHLGLPSHLCVYSEQCGKGVALEHDGSVFSCDHYVYPEYRLGNIHSGQLAPMVFSRDQVRFGYAKSEMLPQECLECPYLSDCWGECPKNRFLQTATGEPGLNYLCRGLKQFFAHAIPEVDRIAAEIRKQGLQPRRRM